MKIIIIFFAAINGRPGATCIYTVYTHKPYMHHFPHISRQCMVRMCTPHAFFRPGCLSKRDLKAPAALLTESYKTPIKSTFANVILIILSLISFT